MKFNSFIFSKTSKISSFFFCLTTFFIPNSNAQSKVGLVAYGGGSLSKEMRQEFLKFSKKENPKVLIVSYASPLEEVMKTAQKNAKQFADAGAEKIRILDLKNIEKAKEDIRWSDVIWMSGGSQTRLRKAFEEANLVSEIQSHFQSGGLVGGTSAGASIQSDVMMANVDIDPETKRMNPVISYGFCLFKEGIIDQHFSERNRLERLQIAIEKNPHLIGIGIDESTGVAFERQGGFSVLGKGTVTVIRSGNSSKTEIITLKKEDRYPTNP